MNTKESYVWLIIFCVSLVLGLTNAFLENTILTLILAINGALAIGYLGGMSIQNILDKNCQ